MAIKRVLVARGWQEAITFSFVSSAWEIDAVPGRDARAAPIRVLNPIAAHLDVMRTTLAGGLIDVLRTNLARKQERVRIFEAGRCFWRADAGLRAADAPRRPRVRRRAARAMGTAPAGPSTSSTSRATSQRWWRRER